MRLTNATERPLGLPSGLVLQPGKSAEVRDWDRMKENRVVQSWVANDKLVVGGSATGDDAGNGGGGGDGGLTEDEEKDAIIAELLTFDVRRTKQTSLEKLRELLTAEKAKAKGGA